MKKLALLALTLLLLGPSTILLGVATLGGTPATAAVCTPGSLAVGPIPDSLTATTRNGETVTLNRQQLNTPRRSSRSAGRQPASDVKGC